MVTNNYEYLLKSTKPIPSPAPATKNSASVAKPPTATHLKKQARPTENAASVLDKSSQSGIAPARHIERTIEPNERTVKPNGQAERSSILNELEQGVQSTQRLTERYSFEIYSDQIGRIEEIQYRYKRKTGKKLSASRIIREALEEYLIRAEKAL